MDFGPCIGQSPRFVLLVCAYVLIPPLFLFSAQQGGTCIICKQECLAHKCQSCHNNCHAIEPCGKPVGEEGYGGNVICANCSANNESKGMYSFDAS